MQITWKPDLATRRTAVLVLENDAERALSSEELLRIVDNGAGIRYDHSTDSHHLTGEPFGPVRHFGGRVEPDGVNRVKVTVYID